MKKSILIVEDELRIRFLLRDYLTKDDFNVFEASNGEEGLFVFSYTKNRFSNFRYYDAYYGWHDNA